MIRLVVSGHVLPESLIEDDQVADSISTTAFAAALVVEGWAAEIREFARDVERALVADGDPTVFVKASTLELLRLAAVAQLAESGDG